MRSYIEQRAMLARMERARAETERHLSIIERQIAARAERMTPSTRVKAQFGRASTTWTRADDRDFQENLAALARKLARQAGAIAAFRVRHRINEPEQKAVS